MTPQSELDRDNLDTLRGVDARRSAVHGVAVIALIKDGQLLADHQISRARFRNIMRAAA